MPLSDNLKVEILKLEDVAPLFKVTPSKLPSAIKNGTFPVGLVIESGKTRTIIIKKRLEAWLNAEDLKK